MCFDKAASWGCYPLCNDLWGGGVVAVLEWLGADYSAIYSDGDSGRGIAHQRARVTTKALERQRERRKARWCSKGKWPALYPCLCAIGAWVAIRLVYVATMGGCDRVGAISVGIFDVCRGFARE